MLGLWFVVDLGSWVACKLTKLAAPGGSWHLISLLLPRDYQFFIEITCWAPWIAQVWSVGLLSHFLNAQISKGSYCSRHNKLILHLKI